MKRRKKAETMKKCLKSQKECAKIRDKFLKGYERDSVLWNLTGMKCHRTIGNTPELTGRT